jgi:hypothetical protein
VLEDFNPAGLVIPTSLIRSRSLCLSHLQDFIAMAPLVATLTSAAFELRTKLIARQMGNPGNKSPEAFAHQGRYAYTPSFGAAVLFVVLFAIVTLAHVFLIFRHRSWFWWSMNLAVISKYFN